MADLIPFHDLPSERSQRAFIFNTRRDATKPIPLIISAFSAGAAATAKYIAGQAVKNAHDSLKAK